jgi:type IV secretion system protein VirB1
VRLAQRCAPTVAPTTLAAIAITESGFNPLSIHDNTLAASDYPSTAAEAVSLATTLIAAGRSVDLGLMQINSANLRALGLTPEAAFDPCQSLAAGGAILQADYAGGATHAEQQIALRIAFSRYNTGTPLRGFANGYVGRVESAARQVVPAIDPNVDVSSSTLAAAAGQISARAGTASLSSPWLVWTTSHSLTTRTAEETDQRATILSDAGHGASAAVVAYPESP